VPARVSSILELAPADIAPDRTEVLRQLGIPAGADVSERIERLYGAAAELFATNVAPAGVLAAVTRTEFEAVYRGEGNNEPESPVADIFPRAEHLALFAVTLGPRTTEALGRCFAAQDFALAYMLDAMASVAADAAADVTERRFEQGLRARGWSRADGAALRYSPGYCGWDVTGQKRLFAELQPEAIGLTLTESCLMQPLKSVSGVILAGPRAIHRFPPSYDFCERCETRTCRERLRALAARTAVKSAE
jgi:hypothetical protein